AGGTVWVSLALVSFGFAAVCFWKLSDVRSTPVVTPVQAEDSALPASGSLGLPRWLALLAVVLFFATRFWRWGTLLHYPLGDEPMEGLDSWQISQGDYLPVFLPWGGRLPLYHYLVAILFRALGPTLTALRLISVRFGFLCFVATALLAKRLFGSKPGENLGASLTMLTAL